MTDYGHDLRFGLFPTPNLAQARALVDLVVLADREGLDLVSVQDHPYLPKFLDTWTLLSYLAAVTDRVHLAPNVANLPLRPPAVLARSAASLDVLSGGRVELGLGAGAFWEGIEAMGGPRRSPGEAVASVEEAIAVVRALWDPTPRRVRAGGQHYRIDGAKPGPAPAHPMEIWLGAYGPRMLGVTGRLADGWLPSAAYLEPAKLAAANRTIDRAAEDAGRSPAQIRRLYNINGTFGPGGAGFPQGPATAWVEQLSELAVEEGISTFILGTDEPDALQVFAREVAPAVREQVAAERAAAERSATVDGQP